MDVHWMMFAEGAEVVNNKLYLMGAGWDTVLVNGALPHLHHIALAVTFRIPWDSARMTHTMSLEFRTPSNQIVPVAEGIVEPGHPALPPLLPHAFAHMAISSVMELSELGIYHMIVRIGEDVASTLPLRVAAGPFFAETSR